MRKCEICGAGQVGGVNEWEERWKRDASAHKKGRGGGDDKWKRAGKGRNGVNEVTFIGYSYNCEMRRVVWTSEIVGFPKLSLK